MIENPSMPGKKFIIVLQWYFRDMMRAIAVGSSFQSLVERNFKGRFATKACDDFEEQEQLAPKSPPRADSVNRQHENARR